MGTIETVEAVVIMVEVVVVAEAVADKDLLRRGLPRQQDVNGAQQQRDRDESHNDQAFAFARGWVLWAPAGVMLPQHAST